MASDLKPMENQWFTAQQRRAQQAFNLGTQQNDYERRLANTQAQWGQDDLRRTYARQREQFGNSFNRRGMMNSGVYQQSLSRFIDDYNTSQSRLSTGNLFRNEGFDLAGNQLAQVRDSTLSELRDQREAYQRQLAEMLRTYGS